MAKNFAKNPEKTHILLLPAEYLYLQRNDKGNVCENLQSPEADSCAAARSIYLKHIDADQFLNSYFISLKNALLQMGLHIYAESEMSVFLNTEARDKHIITIAQAELEEVSKIIQVDENDSNTKIVVEEMVFNCWFEVNSLNDTAKGFQVFYVYSILEDELIVDYREAGTSGYYFLNYDINKLSLADVNSLPINSGWEHSSAVFDFLMNAYVRRKSKASNIPLLHFDRRNKWIYRPNKAIYTEM